MSFFDSELVKKELDDIRIIHQTLVEYAINYENLDKDARLILLDEIAELIEKQKIFYTRLSLSDDERAVRLKEEIEIKMRFYSPALNHLDVMSSLNSLLIRLQNLKLKEKKR